jgi:uncharacterized protein (TIGR03382 family)
VDGDGDDDRVLGAYEHDNSGTESGSVYVYYGGCSANSDGDGFCFTEDCDDGDANTYPGAAASDSATDCMTDADSDGFGDDTPATGVTAGTDCDDTDDAIHPNAIELLGDTIDQDCDGADTPQASDTGGPEDQKSGCSGCAAGGYEGPAPAAGFALSVGLMGWVRRRRDGVRSSVRSP